MKLQSKSRSRFESYSSIYSCFSFKIVTLSDAVIHLLLVISETVEEPDSCRLFIRLIINFLRDRVNLNTDQPGTVEESMENKAALMDLPLPVLLLMKSLLRGVTRCQIFVDEGGKLNFCKVIHFTRFRTHICRRSITTFVGFCGTRLDG